MNRQILFRALKPIAGYPFSPLDLSLNGVRYDLILPTRVGIAFKNLLSDCGPYHRLDSHCCQSSFEMLRTQPEKFASEIPSYAETCDKQELGTADVPVGYIVQHSAANAAAAQKIQLAVIEGPPLSFDVIDWIFGHAPILEFSGGFEIAQLITYAGHDERETAIASAAGTFDEAEPNPYQPHVTRLFVEKQARNQECRP